MKQHGLWIEDLKKQCVKSELDALKIDYGFSVLKNELTKLGLLYAFFLITGAAAQFLFTLLILVPLRFHSGGSHMKSSLTCFLFTFSVFYLSVCILPQIPLSTREATALLAVVLISINAIGPLPSRKKPIRSRKKYTACQERLLIISLAEFLLLVLFRHSSFFICGVWILTLQLFQLLPNCKLRKQIKEGLL